MSALLRAVQRAKRVHDATIKNAGIPYCIQCSLMRSNVVSPLPVFSEDIVKDGRQEDVGNGEKHVENGSEGDASRRQTISLRAHLTYGRGIMTFAGTQQSPQLKPHDEERENTQADEPW